MGLIKCSECGKEMSSQAKTCTSCGAPNKIQSTIKLVSWIVVIILFIIAALVKNRF